MGSVDNWQALWNRCVLIRKDGIHPTLDGATLISKKSDQVYHRIKTLTT